ncbi:aminotransferase class III-fold pyridoxal phosphate-dependent enzyme [Streptomyces griseus]|uniref:aminotransferase class III-fold pyridoxal phosphate-dependent enzyme n=1 Tax=Streptomyces griseus TaxID=1911 RepID=UPI000D13F333
MTRTAAGGETRSSAAGRTTTAARCRSFGTLPRGTVRSSACAGIRLCRRWWGCQSSPLDLLDEDKLLPRVTELEQLLARELHDLTARTAVVETRVAGFLGGLTLTDDISAEAVTDELVEHGFVTRPLRGNTVQISPPFITTDDAIRQLVAAIDTVLSVQEAK